MTVNKPALRIADLERAVLQVFPDSSLELPEGEDGLHEACGADRMTAGEEPSGRVHGNFIPAVRLERNAVIHVRKERRARLDELPAFAVPAETQVFVRLDLG